MLNTIIDYDMIIYTKIFLIKKKIKKTYFLKIKPSKIHKLVIQIIFAQFQKKQKCLICVTKLFQFLKIIRILCYDLHKKGCTKNLHVFYNKYVFVDFIFYHTFFIKVSFFCINNKIRIKNYIFYNFVNYTYSTIHQKLSLQ